MTTIKVSGGGDVLVPLSPPPSGGPGRAERRLRAKPQRTLPGGADRPGLGRGAGACSRSSRSSRSSRARAWAGMGGMPAAEEERKKQAAQIKKEKKKAARQAENGRKGAPWTEAEHVAFLAGLRKFGKGNWRAIARCYVPSRTPTQVASHAQKHYLRVQGAPHV